ncbi:MAG: hypothetical protein V4664_00735 [Patescibacteria group bacterium]
MSYQVIPEIEGGFTTTITLGPSDNDLQEATGPLFGRPKTSNRLRAAIGSTIRELIPKDKIPTDLKDPVGWLDYNRIEFDLQGCTWTDHADLPLHLSARMIWPGSSLIGWIIEIRYDVGYQHGRLKVTASDVRCMN